MQDVSLHRHRVEDAVYDAFEAVFGLSGRRVLVSAAATVWTAWVEWRTWSTSAGQHPSEAVEHHFYWPAYEWTHTDFVVGPSSLGLVLTFLFGVALWYVPVSVADAILRRFVRRLGVTRRLRGTAASTRRVGRWVRHRFHSFGLLALVAFSVVGSVVPPQSPASLFTFPGILVVLEGAAHFGDHGYLTDRLTYLVVPAAYLCWYTVGVVAWDGYWWLRS